MPLVRCKLGYAETRVGDQTYVFARDRAGRHVAHVDDPRHLLCFKDLEAYEFVEDLPPITGSWEAPPPAGTVDPAVKAMQQASAPAGKPKPVKAGKAGKPATSQPQTVEGDKPLEDQSPFLSKAAKKAAANAAASPPDMSDLQVIAGIGPAIVEQLHGMGITTLQQIADMSPELQAGLDQQLKPQGKVSRDDWIGQAKAIVAEMNKPKG